MDYVALGKNIKKYRLIAGLKQSELAEICDCSDSHIGQMENARNVPSLEMIVRIANALSVTVDQLLCESYTQPEQIYFKDIVARIEKFPVAQRIAICEAFESVVQATEKVKGSK